MIESQSSSSDRRRRRSRDRSSRVSSRMLLLVAIGLVAVAITAGVIGFTIGSGAAPSEGNRTAVAAASGSVDAASLAATVDSGSPGAAVDDGTRATRVRIERLGIDLEIIEGDGIDAPIGKAAHYPGTAWPGGELNNVYIYGHAQEGMFLTLWEAQVGDEVVLELEDGTERTYVVTEVLPEVPWDALEYLDPTPNERLTLQTSTSYEPTSPKFIVIAEPQP